MEFKFLTLALLIITIFSNILINASPILSEKREIVGEVAFADLLLCDGRVTFTQLNGFTRVTGQFNIGFTDPDPNDYKFRVVNKNGKKKKRDFTNEIIKQLFINPPGTSPFLFDQNFQVKCVVGKFFSIKLKGKEICRGEIKAI
nr:4545_t:CDS:1 [Entrophospora candida]